MAARPAATPLPGSAAVDTGPRPGAPAAEAPTLRPGADADPASLVPQAARSSCPAATSPPPPANPRNQARPAICRRKLIPALLAYEPLPTPAPAPELALRVRIPAIGVDHPVVQGDDWEQLKLGVGQHIGSAHPGRPGNVVLSAHNDIYGEIFRHLDRLAAGNEVIISTASRDYTYVIEDLRIVEPTDVYVMAPTDTAAADAHLLLSVSHQHAAYCRVRPSGRPVELSPAETGSRQIAAVDYTTGARETH